MKTFDFHKAKFMSATYIEDTFWFPMCIYEKICFSLLRQGFSVVVLAVLELTQ